MLEAQSSQSMAQPTPLCWSAWGYDGKLNIYKVDTEAEQELAGVFGIRSIPSLLFIPLNDQPQMAMGALPKDAFKKAFKDVLGVE